MEPFRCWVHVLTGLHLRQRSEGHLKEMQIHESAIGQIVRMRGGLKNFGRKVLQMFLSCYALPNLTSILTFQPVTDCNVPVGGILSQPLYSVSALNSNYALRAPASNIHPSTPTCPL